MKGHKEVLDIDLKAKQSDKLDLVESLIRATESVEENREVNEYV
jgi:hypothetical protein